jgi:hypothetical protein
MRPVVTYDFSLIEDCSRNRLGTTTGQKFLPDVRVGQGHLSAEIITLLFVVATRGEPCLKQFNVL